MKSKHSILTKKYLYKEYIMHKKSMPIIAKITGCSVHSIRDRIVKYRIIIRTSSECQRGELHPNFGKKRPKHSKFMEKHNPFKGKQHNEETLKKIILKNIGKHFSPLTEFTSEKLIKMWSIKEFKRKMSLIHGGTGIPYELTKYPTIFYYLKESIRKRDKYKCQVCHKKGKSVHHIDYNKQNCSKSNLITLCLRCHCKTNTNRDYWYAYFRYIMGRNSK